MQPDSSTNLLSLPLPGNLVGQLVARLVVGVVVGNVGVLAQQGLLNHSLVEPFQLLVHPWEEEQGQLLHQDQGNDLSKVSSEMAVLQFFGSLGIFRPFHRLYKWVRQFSSTHLEHHEDTGVLQEPLHIERLHHALVQPFKPWLKQLKKEV